jgi:hypothetical protein
MLIGAELNLVGNAAGYKNAIFGASLVTRRFKLLSHLIYSHEKMAHPDRCAIIF